MKFVTSLAALAIAAVPAGALAQESPAFGGLYAGALVGYDHVRIGDDTDHGSKDGVVYGATIGYDLTFSNTGLVGIEGEVSGSSVKKTYTDVVLEGDTTAIKAGRDFYLGVRSTSTIASVSRAQYALSASSSAQRRSGVVAGSAASAQASCALPPSFTSSPS